MMPTIYVERFAANTSGRDFIAGDLHGCLQTQQERLDDVKFDPARDRLFSVGDLIDRGPDSPGCLALLDQPWFHAVRGNHEDMLLCAINQQFGFPGPRKYDAPLELFLSNGGEWALAGLLARDGMFVEIRSKLLALPHIIAVGAGSGRFNVVHAELFDPAQEITDEVIDSGNFLHPEVAEENMLWSRRMVSGIRKEHLPVRRPGLSPTYCGHTVVPKVRMLQSHVYLDTGAVLSCPQEKNGHGLALVQHKPEGEPND